MRTLLIIKPDGVLRGLVGEIIHRFESYGIRIMGLKMVNVTEEMAERLYSIHKGKPFYNELIGYITSSPVVAAVLEIDSSAKDAICLVRKVIGATNPLEAEMGTIRGDYAFSITKNIVHASDSEESSNYEIPIFFSKKELVKY